MNKIITLISFCFVLIFNNTFAQKLEYETTSPWFWGLNAGATWNTTDVHNKTYAGWGLTLGRSLNFDYGNVFSFDIRGRYLGGTWKGQDFDSTSTFGNQTLSSGNTNYDTILGYSVNNFGTKVHEVDLELVVHFNRLIEKTGLDPYFFGGVGVSFYNTKGNLIDQNTDQLYDYNSLSDFSKSSINGLLDKSYETALDGTSGNRFNAQFMPSLGVGIGYYLGKRFSMGIEHKTTFTLLDDFDGYTNQAPNKFLGIDFKNDIYHYTSVYFKYYFKNHKYSGSTTNNNTNNTNNVNNGSGDCQKPIIRINQPVNNQTVKVATFTFTADVAHTNAASDIQVSVNGSPTTNFSYSNQTNKLAGTGYLKEGQNTIVITSTNTCGSVTETVYVNYVPDCIQPTVRFTNPVNSGGSVNSGTYYVTADIINLAKNEGITFNVNGVRVSNYSFNAQSGKFSATINLRQGQNNLDLIATNNCGTANNSTLINYNYNCPSPVITAMNTSNGVNVSSELYTFEASFQNVKSANQVSLTLNGAAQNQGQYNASKGWYQNVLRLKPGQNILVFTATNECGTTSQTVVINYSVPCSVPAVAFKNPSSAGQNVNSSTYTISAGVYNLTGSNSVVFKVNGNVVTNYSFNSQSGDFLSTINLQAGANTIEIIATNACGTTSQVTVINYNYSCPKPTVQIIYPELNASVSNATYTVQALVTNITTSSQVQLYVNGVLKTGGTYNASNSIYSCNVTLNNGSNTIEVKATNNCGTISSSSSITYTRVVIPAPVITMTGTCDATVEAGQQYISGIISGITSESQLSLSVNGVAPTNVTYAPTSQGVNFGFYINALSNIETYVIIVTATNVSGTVSKTCVIRVNKPDENIVICVLEGRVRVTKTIKLSQWPQYQAQGATLGECPTIVDADIKICMTQNGKKVTKTIKQSQWPQYQAQGATLGECPVIVDEDIVICVLEGSVRITKTIKLSQWPQYQSQGATLGKCPEVVDEDIVICVLEGRVRVTKTIKQSQWPQYQAQGATLGKCPEVVADPDIKICMTQNGKKVTKTVKQSQWPQYQAQGATLGECPAVEDEKIIICHIPPGNNSNPQTIEIPLSAWPAHQAHGDQLGKCPEVVEEDIIICVLEGRVRVTKTIKQSQWAQYQAQGATLGKCPEVAADPDIKICMTQNGKKVTKTVKQSQWPQYQAQGATLGECPAVEDEKIIICHIPPGNNSNPQTIEIPLSAWPAHQAHGDQLGKCPEVVDEDIIICVLEGRVRVTKTIKQSQWAQYQKQGATLGKCPEVVADPDIKICVTQNGKKVTKTVKQSQWPQYQAQGATLGECPAVEDEKIIICHIPPGNNSNPQTIEIPLSAWPAHQAHGDQLGKCPEVVDEDIIICVLEGRVRVTKTIKQSQWAQYQKQGASLGACPPVTATDSTTTETSGSIEGTVGKNITICVEINGVRQTKVIAKTQWPEYQAQGATLGECVEPKNTPEKDPKTPVKRGGK